MRPANATGRHTVRAAAHEQKRPGVHTETLPLGSALQPRTLADPGLAAPASRLPIPAPDRSGATPCYLKMTREHPASIVRDAAAESKKSAPHAA